MNAATVIMTVVTAVLAHRHKGDSDSRWLRWSKLVSAILTGFSALAAGGLSFFKERQDDVAHAERVQEQADRDQRQKADSAALRQQLDDSRGREETIIGACLDSLAEGRSVSAFLAGLSPAQVEGLKEHRCGRFPAWLKGGAQIRLFTAKRESVAKSVRDHLLNDVLFHTSGQNWSAHVTEVTQSIPTDRTTRDHLVYLVALNQIQGSLERPVCEWLQCMGIDSGVEQCGIRDIESSLAVPAAMPIATDP